MQSLRTRFKFSTRFFALAGALFISMMLGSAAQAQTTIVNYDFNGVYTGYPIPPKETAEGVTSSATSTEPFGTVIGTATSVGAFTQNTTAGNAITMSNSSGTNTRYFQFNLGGPSLSHYTSYKLYFQARRSAEGAQVITLAYSTDGGATFTNVPSTAPLINTNFIPVLFDMAAVTALNNKDNIIFRLLASGASGSGTLRIDNFQVQAVNSPLPTPQLIISEFRTFGPTGPCDDFFEIYNPADVPYTVQSTDGAATGFSLSSFDPINSVHNPIHTIPNGTNIPARGHYLITNAGNMFCGDSAYSSGGYPAGNGTFATGDNVTNIPDVGPNWGLALFDTSSAPNFSLDTRLDAVGPNTLPTDSLYKEGTGYPPIDANTRNYSIYRDLKSGLPKDTNNNDADFDAVNTDVATLCGSLTNFACQRLGAPGPENLSSPVQRNANIKASLIDTQCIGMAVNPTPPSACRFERNTSNLGASPTSFGTISIRRRFTNTTGATVTRLRFRIVDITTTPEGGNNGVADLRAISSSTFTATCQSENGTPHLCSDNPSPLTEIVGTTLEADQHGQENGGGFNSTLTLPNQLANGASINLQFMLGVEANGSFRFFVNVEALTSNPEQTFATKAQATGKARASRIKK